jgi:AraC-like DNA-binding protein
MRVFRLDRAARSEHNCRVIALYQPFPMLPGRAGQVWRHQPAYRRPRHFHDEPELNFVIKGTAHIAVGDRVEELNAGELVLFEPGQDHALLDASADLELFVMALRPELAARAQGERPYVFSRKLVLGPAQTAALTEQSLALADVRDAHAVESAVGNVFSSLGTQQRSSRVTSRRAVGRLRESPEMTATQLSGLVRADPARLSREFHRDLGVTLVEYRARLRFMRFVRLVDAGSSFARAAMDADFGSYAQFHRVFQRAVGCGPREYFNGARAHVDALLEPAGPE